MFWLLGCHYRPSPYLCQVGGLWHRGECGNLFKDRDFPKVFALVFMGVFSMLGIFSLPVLADLMVYLPLMCGYFYFFWVIPSRRILLLGLEKVSCLIYLLRRYLLSFYFQFQASGFFCWIVTAFIHFVVFCILTLQTCYVSSLRRPAMVEFQPWQFCGCWTPASFLWLLLLIPQIIVWAAANRVQG